MKATMKLDRATWRDYWLAVAVFAVGVLGSSAAWPRRTATWTSALASAATLAAATLLIAFILARHSRYPRWGYFGAAAILAAAAPIGLLALGDPVAWSSEVRPSLWLNPWLLLTVPMLTSRSAAGACAPTTRLAGWMLIGIAVVLAVLSHVGALIAIRP